MSVSKLLQIGSLTSEGVENRASRIRFKAGLVVGAIGYDLTVHFDGHKHKRGASFICMNLENYYTAKEAASHLRISVSALHRLCARGRLASVWIGSQRFVRKDAVRLLEFDVDYQRSTRRHNLRGKSLQDLHDEGQICLLSEIEVKDGEA